MAAADVQKAIDRIAPAVMQAWADFQDTKQGQIFSQKMADILKAEPALAWIQKFCSDQVGVCPFNRGGQGFSLTLALCNGIGHLKAGYSFNLVNEGNWALSLNPARVADAVKDAQSW